MCFIVLIYFNIIYLNTERERQLWPFYKLLCYKRERNDRCGYHDEPYTLYLHTNIAIIYNINNVL